MIAGRIVAKSMSNNPDYTLLTPSGWVQVKQESSESDFAIDELVEADSENASSVRKVENPDLERKIELFLKENSKPKQAKLLVDDEAMRKFTPIVEKAVESVARKLLQLTPSLIRFNDDCDGISAGIIVKDAIAKFTVEKSVPYPPGFLKNKQCNSAVYDAVEASFDAERMDSSQFGGKKPLLFLLDFGANEESVDGLEAAKENFDVCVLDHHVYSENARRLANVFLNPLETGGTSSHTTGMVAFEFAQRLSFAEKEFAFYSMESDKSVFWDKVERKQALVLDFLANQGISLDAYAKALESETQFHYAEATARLGACFEKALLSAKSEEISGALLASVNLEGVTAKNEFPPKGKVLNKIQEKFEKQNPLAASVGFDSTTIQFRVSKALHAKGFKATRIIDLLKKEFAGISGGGHEQAAAMRFEKDYAKAVLEKTLESCRNELRAICA
ncbi:MAG: DHH family phosphoesterase [Candidatus Norongarragalinales archaeon]